MLATTLVLAAAVQGLVGLGLALVAAPVVTLLEPRLMPEFMLWLGMMMPVVTLAREHHDIDWRGLGWALPARVLGTVGGVLLVAAVPPAGLGIAVGAVVLLSVMLTVKHLQVPVTVPTLATAGFVSGITGTATGIGGPPIAIVYQHRPPHQIRSTLGVFFVVGATMSLAALGIAGEVEASSFLLAVAMVPSLVLGFGLSRLVGRRLPVHHIRYGVLLVSGASAAVVLGRSLLAV